MRTGSSDENYGALPSSYRKLRKSRSMVTPSLHRSNGQSSPILRLKRSLSRFKPGWRSPGKTDPSPATPTPPSRRPSKLLISTQKGNTKPSSSAEQPAKSPSASFSDHLPRPRTQNGATSKSIPEQAIPDWRSYAHYFDFREYERQGIRLSSREKFRIAAKRVQTRGVRSITTPTSVGRQVVKNRELSLIKKSNAINTHEDKVTFVKGSLIKKLISHPRQADPPSRSDEPILASAFDQYDLNDENTPQESNSSFPAEQDEAADTLAHELHSASSRESLHSNTRSRVTSWTDSSMTGSVALRSGPLDRNRLSVIKEDGGPHQPSSSAGRHIGGVSLFQEPLPSTTSEGQHLPPVDSQRIYSALIKRIEEEEEAEIVETTAALEAVNLERGIRTALSSPLNPTIRMVRSEPSISDGACTLMQQDLGNDVLSQVVPNETPAFEQCEEGTRGAEQPLPGQDVYPSFLPVSFPNKPTRSGPFRKLFRERYKYSDSISSRDDGSLVINRQSKAPKFGGKHYGNSSESIYSRRTNGLSYEDYMSADGSFASMVLPPTRLLKSKSMTEPMHTMRMVPRSTSRLSSEGQNKVSISESKAWQDATNFSISSHVWEQAQMHPDCTNKFNRIVSESGLDIISGNNVPGLSIRDMNQGSTPGNSGVELRAHTSASSRMRTLFKRATSGGLRNPDQPLVVEGKQSNEVSGRAQQLLPDSTDVQVTPLQAEKEGHNKENHLVDQNSTPPLSTPGRLQLQFRNGSRNGRLRKRASEVLFNSRKGSHLTPTSNPRTVSRNFSINTEESPGQRAKSRLVARLSRPFDMDVPPLNRPFDSMYLGKRTPGHADTLGNSRLSVAPRASKSYSSLRIADEEIGGDTGLTANSSSSLISRNASKVLGFFGSKRMVSNFLKSRREGGSLSPDERATLGGSPAFL